MRTVIKRGLAVVPTRRQPRLGATVLIYHRVGGRSIDERDVAFEAFVDQLDMLQARGVVSLDEAVARLTRGDSAAGAVITFDDGFSDVYTNAWPLLKHRQLPFTVYLSTAYINDIMHWDGSTAKDQKASALSWKQLQEMVDSGLCTIGNHTHTHPRPEMLTAQEIDVCTGNIRDHLGVVPQHFAYTWGIYVPKMRSALESRFLSAATGVPGHNLPNQDPLRLHRIAVRRSDPLAFFAAKLEEQLWAERTYARLVSLAKRIGVHA